MITLTRRYYFPASHRLHAPQLSAPDNQRLYGKCNNPYGHGHNYALEVTISGEVDETTGLLCPLETLDRFVETTVLRRFRYCNLNEDAPEFRDLVPTTENVAQVAVSLLQQSWSAYWGNFRVQLYRVHIQETERNRFDVIVPEELGLTS